jgi:hypothetical protein
MTESEGSWIPALQPGIAVDSIDSDAFLLEAGFFHTS